MLRYFGSFDRTGMNLQEQVNNRRLLKAFETNYRKSRPLRKITIVNTHDLIGGAERTSYDLHTALESLAYESALIVGGKLGSDPDVHAVWFFGPDRKLGYSLRRWFGLTEVVYLSPLANVLRSRHFRYCDVVNLHNIHGRYWNLLTVPILTWRKPVVITLHDEFLITGDCGYSYDCQRWRGWCGRCPLAEEEPLTRYPATGPDASRLNVLIKRLIFRSPRRYPLHLVSPSKWLAQRAQESPTLGHLPITVIPYGIPLQTWKPTDQREARQELGLPLEGSIGLFSAVNIHDKRKGLDILIEAIRRLGPSKDLHFLALGQLPGDFQQTIQTLPIRWLGFVKEKPAIAKYISASDFTICLSRADNLPYSVLESLACGRPVLGARVGGLPEIIDHPDLGWLLPLPVSSEEVAGKFLTISQLPIEERQRRFIACRQAAKRKYDVLHMVERYLELMNKMHQDSL
jgi:glycosyltransferase involved in cell wall biosynthesis